MKRFLLALCLVMVLSLCIAQTPGHPNWVSFQKTTPTTGTIKWSAEPAANVDYYYLGLHPTTTVYNAPAYCDPNWNQPGNWAASFTLDSPGVYKLDVVGLNPALDYYAYVAAVETNSWSWGAYSSWESVIPLPVELTSFMASYSASSYVSLSWTSQTETNMRGYRVYRSEVQDISEAVNITPTMIPATNTSTACTYNHRDDEVNAEQTYWYWLESCGFQNSEMHGPISVSIPGEQAAPQLPEGTALINVYPNPAKVGEATNMEVEVKAGETASISIYNARGQALRTYDLNEGFHQISWDGLDQNGNTCANGMYFCRISSASMNNTRKLIRVK